jgi:hypothetical protein
MHGNGEVTTINEKINKKKVQLSQSVSVSGES